MLSKTGAEEGTHEKLSNLKTFKEYCGIAK